MYAKGSEEYEELLKQGYLANGLELLPKGLVFRGFVVYVGGRLAPFRVILDFLRSESTLIRLSERLVVASRELAKEGVTYSICFPVEGEGIFLNEIIHSMNAIFSFEEKRLLLAA